MIELTQDMYTAEVYYVCDDDPPRFAVYMVFAIDDKEAMKKVLVLGSPYQISSIHLRRWTKSYLKQIARAMGGTIVTDVELPHE